MKGKTPDEKLLFEFYRVSKGDTSFKIDINLAAKKIGLKETALKNIVKHLAQANFIKKLGDRFVSLTDNGCRFIAENS